MLINRFFKICWYLIALVVMGALLLFVFYTFICLYLAINVDYYNKWSAIKDVKDRPLLECKPSSAYLRSVDDKYAKLYAATAEKFSVSGSDGGQFATFNCGLVPEDQLTSNGCTRYAAEMRILAAAHRAEKENCLNRRLSPLLYPFRIALAAVIDFYGLAIREVFRDFRVF